MTKPACVNCQRFYRPYKNGIRLAEQKPLYGANPGTEETRNWIPYKVWVADAWKCEGCDHVIVVGYGYQPLWEDYYKEERPEPHYTINDC